MTTSRFEFGDQVRHPNRPEWGVGNVVKTEDVAVNGVPAQRVSARFPNAGLKVLSTTHVVLERVDRDASDDGSLAAIDDMHRSDWLAPVAEKKIEEVMMAIAEEAKDPFASLQARLGRTLQLYRFGRDGGSLVDWAVVQSGLDDPLSRFTRQELEVLFDRWATERDAHLLRLLQDLGDDSALLETLLKDAPREARSATDRMRRTV